VFHELRFKSYHLERCLYEPIIIRVLVIEMFRFQNPLSDWLIHDDELCEGGLRSVEVEYLHSSYIFSEKTV